MKHPRILAFSSSREGKKGYLETVAPVIKTFLGNAPLSIAFIPFAAVDNDYELYTAKVRKGLSGLPYSIKTVIPKEAKIIIEESDVIMVGGGNTFKLLHDLYDLDLPELIKEKVAGGTPYIGWSAGSNITGVSISTTNDMPIIQPQRFTALGFFPFHINPHYHNTVVHGFNGETRDQRLTEFLQLNSSSSVICLPEGTAIKYEKEQLIFIGSTTGHRLLVENKMLVRQALQPGIELPF